jgi:DNA topoisomerase-1
MSCRPFLWRKVRYGLSAGRVQSVAVRLVVEREREIQAFKKEEYWSIEGLFHKKANLRLSRPALHSSNGKSSARWPSLRMKMPKQWWQPGAEKFALSGITVKETNRNPAPPFTTSTLQQEASRKLGFSAKQTMTIAQKLYEQGHITYMRTDSVNLGRLRARPGPGSDHSRLRQRIRLGDAAPIRDPHQRRPGSARSHPAH